MMNSVEIKRQFAEEGSDLRSDLSQCSAHFADWIAEKASALSASDMQLLMRLGGALHAAEAEQKWQGSWS